MKCGPLRKCDVKPLLTGVALIVFLLTCVAGLIVLACIVWTERLPETDREVVAYVFQVLQNLVTCVAIVLGGIWTYRLFVQNRLGRPHANLQQTCTSLPLDENTLFLRVNVTLRNEGNTAIVLVKSEVRISQVLPKCAKLQITTVDDESFGAVSGAEGLREVEWAPFWQSLREWNRGECIIEPGESDEFCHDFILPSGLRAVQIYSFVENQYSHGRSLGWHRTSIQFLDGCQVRPSGVEKEEVSPR